MKRFGIHLALFAMLGTSLLIVGSEAQASGVCAQSVVVAPVAVAPAQVYAVPQQVLAVPAQVYSAPQVVQLAPVGHCVGGCCAAPSALSQRVLVRPLRGAAVNVQRSFSRVRVR